MGNFVGIDLGTTYSVVAYINKYGKAEVIPNRNGNTVTPSVIYFGDESPIVGDEAKEYQETGATEIASFFKRSMDDAYFQLTFHGRDYTAIDLSALVLGYLKQQAEDFLQGTVTDAVITVPAYFTNVQRTATIEAGKKAGLNVLRIINEPTAAALAYGLRPSQQTQKVLVYDLGGGTFDISLVSITPTELQVIATDGDHRLGGKDWDDRLISYLETQFEQEFGIELLGNDVNELRVLAEKTKRSLSSKQSVDVCVQTAGNVGTYTITRATFEDLTRDLMERTQILTERVLKEANLSWQDLSGVLPVGGSTKMPMVIDYIKHMSGKPPMSGINPDEAVALGAAIQAAIDTEQTQEATVLPYRLAGRKSTVDVIAHSLGMIAENADRSHYINSIIIRKNLAIPSIETRPYQMTMRRDGDTELEVFLTQSESGDPQECTYLGCYTFSDFPPVRERTTVLDITYEYDKNGTVHISAVERASGQPLKLAIHPVPPDVPERFLGKPTAQQGREHMTIYLAFDVSGSMAGAPIEEAKKAAHSFVSQCDLSSTSIGLIAFSDRVQVGQHATQNVREITDAITNLRSGSTGIGNRTDPFDEILTLLSNEHGLHYALVLADGVWSYQQKAEQKAKSCHQAGIEIVAIGFGSADRKFLNAIASSSEQSIFTDMNRLTDTFSTIAREITESGGRLR